MKKGNKEIEVVGDRVLIVPDGALSLVSLGALPSGAAQGESADPAVLE